MDTIEIIDYRAEHQSSFEGLNRAWIEKYLGDDLAAKMKRAAMMK